MHPGWGCPSQEHWESTRPDTCWVNCEQTGPDWGHTSDTMKGQEGCRIKNRGWVWSGHQGL